MFVTVGTVTPPAPAEIASEAGEPELTADDSVVDGASESDGPRPDPRRKYWTRGPFVLLGVAVLAVIGLTRRAAVVQSIAHLGHLRWVWVPVALSLEWSSLSVFARMQRRLLGAGGGNVASGPMLATVYAANALSTSVPLAGPELGAAFTYRRFKRQGIDAPLAGWSLMVGGVISPVAGIFVFMAGALLSRNDLLAVFGILGGALGVTTIVVMHAATQNSRLRCKLEPVASEILRRGRRLLRRPAGEPKEDVRAWADRLASLHLEPSVWIWVGALALANWLTDAGVFAASIYAVGAAVPWQALLLVYGSGVLVRSLGITPGGLGLVEGTLCLGLVASGVHVGLALASVLLYRLISFWMVAGAGWVVLLFLRRDRSATMITNRALSDVVASRDAK
jgi:uncharacterized protein (TIRG00374 family)